MVKVEHSTVSRWYSLVGAVHEPGPTPQNAAAFPLTVHATHTTSSTTASSAPHSVGLLPTTQGFGVSPNDPICLDLDSPMDPRNFDTYNPSNLVPLPSSSFIASGAAAGCYRNNAQSLHFSPSATLGPTYIPPSNSGIFNPHYARTNFTAATAEGQSFNPSLLSTGQKPVTSLVPDQVKQYKCWKLETHDTQEVDQQAGAHQVDHCSKATHVPPLDLPQGMSKNEYLKLLYATIAEIE